MPEPEVLIVSGPVTWVSCPGACGAVFEPVTVQPGETYSCPNELCARSWKLEPMPVHPGAEPKVEEEKLR